MTVLPVALRRRASRVRAGSRLLGPAFVAAVAYVDPGNVATNVTGGARYGYLLVWVVLVANLMAGLVQYLSAKLGLVTGASLPELVAGRLPGPLRLAYWAQAELVALATDLAEVVGGAVALNLLFGLPLPVGGLVTGVVALALLLVQNRRGQRPFERVVTGLLLVIATGFVAGLLVTPPSPAGVLGGLVPRLAGPDSVLLAAGMLGATVMPHVVYLHSALARDRHGGPRAGGSLRRRLAANRFDVGLAMALAGAVNLAMLLLAAAALTGRPGTGTLAGVSAALGSALGAGVQLVFALGLLASGLASASVGCYAGAVVMQGLLRRRVALPVRRVATLLPALLLLGAGVDATRLLVVSQVVLSFGIPFAVIPLIRLTARVELMGWYANRRATTALAGAVAVAVITVNLVLIGFIARGG